MNADDFIEDLLEPIHAFCRSLDDKPPAYSYIPLTTDEQRVRVMKSRLYNEQRAADLYGTWLRTTPEFEVKVGMAASAHEEMTHARLLARRIRDLGHDPFDYKPLPAQVAMFNALEGLTETGERIAGFSVAGETVANHLIELCLKSPSVPEWIKEPYRRITEDEAGHASGPREFLRRHATTPELQERARRAVAMRMVLFREYLASLDRWAMGEAPW